MDPLAIPQATMSIKGSAFVIATAAALLWLGACGDDTVFAVDAGSPPGDAAAADVAIDVDAGPTPAAVHASDVPVDGLSAEDIKLFHDGDALFDVPFRAPDGLGPLYIRDACSACHDGAARGPGLVQKMAVVLGDGVTPAADQSALPFGHTVRRGLAAGAGTPIVPPDAGVNVKVTTRVGPPVLGLGYLEAIAESEILRVASEQAARADGIHGVVNRVVFASVPNPDATFGTHAQGEANLVGRFGLKARIVSLDDFTADALQGDMGITSPMRPTELPNPDGLTDDVRAGTDLDIDKVNLVAAYLRRVAIPVRTNLDAQGRALFDTAKCSVCHVPSLRTRADYPIKPIANASAALYTDVLLHDMGDALADGQTDGSATSRQWRTAPLVGLRFSGTFLHDGRVTSLDAAILAHGGEAKPSADAFSAMSAGDKAALLRFVGAL